MRSSIIYLEGCLEGVGVYEDELEEKEEELEGTVGGLLPLGEEEVCGKISEGLVVIGGGEEEVEDEGRMDIISG